MSSTESNPDRENAPADRRRSLTINEDWAATIVGLILLGLVLTGLIPGWLVP